MIRRWVEQLWYSPSGIVKGVQWLLLPLSLLFCLLVSLRRWGYQNAILKSAHPGVPVVVVGNISVGGSGKTPLVIALVHWLQQQGHTPAVVSRGYGRVDEEQLIAVTAVSDPQQVGDEPLLIAQQSGAIVVVAGDRYAAASHAISLGASIIVGDDGLQHYRLQRDFEIAVVDSQRQFGNRYCLPAGPLREGLPRLHQVDAVVLNGGGDAEQITPGVAAMAMQLRAGRLYQLGAPERYCELSELVATPLHAVAGIAHPERFFTLLQNAGIRLIPHPFPDHHPYNSSDFEFAERYPVVITEKDAVKCAELQLEQLIWVLPVTVEIDPQLLQRLSQQLPSLN
ncbi:MAG: tetraacyldisaccharide 4'-kinase [Gammaproteobacteria bacterium]|nr:tetraacyldisaccharide 4'-kinase [Gammaproteobacteria bacterium]